MKITVRITTGSNPKPAGIFRVRKWGDPLLVKYGGWTTANVGSNFQPVMLAVFNTLNQPEFGGVHIFQRVDEAFLKSLQYAQPGTYGEINRIYNWLINSTTPAGRPYWYENGQLVFGAIVFGGQLVQVETDAVGRPVSYTRYGRYPAETDADKRYLVFYRLLGIRKAQVEAWRGRDGRAYHPQYPYLIQHCTEAGLGDVYSEYPRGVEIFHPVWDARDYPHNKKIYDPGLYIARDFLEP